MREESTIEIEPILGSIVAVWETDGRGRSVSAVYVCDEAETDARADFRRMIDRNGRFDGRRV